MCGRFTLAGNLQAAAEAFGIDPDELAGVPPRYNIAPTQNVSAVRIIDGKRAHRLLRWGLIPAWATEPTIGSRMINARAETAAEKPAFKKLLRQRRCLILADGFYEWALVGKRKQPYYFQLIDGRPFAFAGLWDRWVTQDGEIIESCTILTTQANELVGKIHQRMPVILEPHDGAQWLNPEVRDASLLTPLLRSFNDAEMTAVAVGPRVSNVRNDDAMCLEAEVTPD